MQLLFQVFEWLQAIVLHLLHLFCVSPPLFPSNKFNKSAAAEEEDDAVICGWLLLFPKVPHWTDCSDALRCKRAADTRT